MVCEDYTGHAECKQVACLAIKINLELILLMASHSKIELLKNALERAYQGSQWHSFKSALKGITQEEALWKPDHYEGFPWMDGSAQQIIFHVGGDSFYQLDHALGQRALTWDALLAQFQASGGHLPAALQMADSGYQALQQALSHLSDQDLSKKYQTPEKKGERIIEEFFEMMIEHHFYHAGQIVYIRSMWKVFKKKPF